MNGAFYIGATGLDAQQKALGAIANNVANINTPAFRRASVSFGDMIGTRRTADDLPIASADGNPAFAGVRVATQAQVWSAGALRQTGDRMDLAIAGDGLVELIGPAGQTLLSRAGTLRVDAEGFLADAAGMRLRAMIAVPDGASDLTIAADGAVSARMPDEADAREIGRIDLVQVRDPAQLVARGDGHFEIADEALLRRAEPGQEGAGRFVQGSIEQGNVSLADEMVAMMLVQRAFAASAQAVQAGDQLMSIANGLYR